jgi:hypothetical protein
MNIKILTLSLQCRESIEVVDFSPQLTHIHGQISAGKSSIMRMIDYCIGGRLERTPAITQELVSVQLSAVIGSYKVLFERQATDSNEVQVTWEDEYGKGVTLLAPIKLSQLSKPIWNSDVYNLSDLLFYLFGVTPIKVRKSKQDDKSPLVRLSFRDIMWYCYLRQDILDSDFYQLTDPFRRLKSRDAMRFITGFYTERMNELEIRLDEVRSKRLAKLESAKQIRGFLYEFGYGTEIDVANEIGSAENELKDARQQLLKLRKKHQAGTHFADELRETLRTLSDRLADEKNTLIDLRSRIHEQESLKAELVTAKFKLARAKAATGVLSGVSFELCPACGFSLEIRPPSEEGSCQLCGSHPMPVGKTLAPQAEIIRRDITSRIDDLTESIARHSKALKNQEVIVAELRERKAKLDAQLTAELSEYDSAYLARSRELERRAATLEERKRSLEKAAKMPQAITRLINEASTLQAEAEELAEQFKLEINKLTEAESLVCEIEDVYLESLIKVGVPGISERDKVQINRRTWIPWIIPVEGDAYTFYDAGSLGKKTLLNVCYALSVHKVAAEHGLPMPNFLMIDTPMKNIGEDVNEDIFRALYGYLYELASGSLSETQFIIIDKEFFPPDPSLELNVSERFMSPQQPLISYYRGP